MLYASLVVVVLTLVAVGSFSLSVLLPCMICVILAEIKNIIKRLFTANIYRKLDKANIYRKLDKAGCIDCQLF